MERFAIPFAKAILFRPERDRFLLQRRVKTDDAYFGLWEVPGGRIREGECLLAALAREVREESGICRIEWLGQIPEGERDHFGGRVRALMPLVTVEIVGQVGPIFGQYYTGVTADTPEATAEAEGHRWVTPAEFRREFLDGPPNERRCTTVDALALRLAFDGPLAAVLERTPLLP